MKNKKYLTLLVTLLLIILIILRPEEKNIYSILPMLGIVLMLFPSNLKLLFSKYENISYSKILDKIFDYSGKGLIIISVLRLLYKLSF